MRLEMPDGTLIILATHADGVVVGTQGRKLSNGDRPQASGMLVTGESAEMLGVLLDCVDEADAAEVLPGH